MRRIAVRSDAHHKHLTIPMEPAMAKASSAIARAGAVILTTAAVVESSTGVAFAASSTVDITNINSILEFVGNIILVVGVVLAAWNLAQAGQSMKDNQGFQLDKNVWGIIGGIAMGVAGLSLRSAGALWHYGAAA